MEITVPKFPGMVYNILDYGADPTGRALSHDAIQKAIDLCSQTGGGTVLIPAGVYITGPIGSSLMISNSTPFWTLPSKDSTPNVVSRLSARATRKISPSPDTALSTATAIVGDLSRKIR